MNIRTKSMLFNFIGFAILFVFFRYVISFFFALGYLPLIVGAALLGSFFTPKFIVKKNELYVKYPFIKELKKWTKNQK